MANYLTTDTDLTAVANAIRTKGGTNATLTFPSGFVSAINAISTGGGGTSSGIDLSGCSFYDITMNETSKAGLNLSLISSAINNNKDFYYIGMVEETWSTHVVAHFKGTQFQEMVAYENTNGYDSSIETDLDGTTWPNVPRFYNTNGIIGFVLVVD